MKWMTYALAAVASTITIACNNSTDKETSNLVDTVVNADTTSLTTLDTTTIDPTPTVTAKVPAKTRESFQKKYPQATNVKWEDRKSANDENDPEMDEPDHKVWFHWQGSEHQSGYDKEGNWVKTTNEISDPASLPAAVNSSIKRSYSGYTVKSVTKEDDKDGISYEVKLEKGDEKLKVELSEDGRVIKSKKSSK
jgi:hypothetical protein